MSLKKYALKSYKVQLLCESDRLVIIGGKELRSREGITQGDPTAMAAYVLGLTPLRDHLQPVKGSVKHVAFVNDLTGGGKLEKIKIWWDA